MTDRGDDSKGREGKGKPRKRKPRLSRKARRARAARRRERMDARRRAQIIIAIAHPLRRRILQTIVDRKEPLSPAEIAREFELPVGTITYHAKVLWHFGALEPAGKRHVRGAIEQFYETTATDDPPIEKLLEEAQHVDDESSEVSEDP